MSNEELMRILNEIIVKNLGHATAYGYAKSKGYTGTEEEFATLMASYATVAQDAAHSAEQAAQSATNAHNSEINAGTSESHAEQSKLDAQAAKNAAETAQGKAEEAQGKAETAETNADGHSEDAEAWAVGTRDSSPVGQTDPTYHNNAKYYAELTGGYVSRAETAADTATRKAQDASDSAGVATQKASDASDSATLAGQKADIATQKASDASDSAGTATQKANDASDSATLAGQKADIATQKASDASDSATLAGQKADIATQKASDASDSATLAGQKADIATQKASDASDSATLAGQKADIATQKASDASGSADAAAASAQEAHETAHLAEQIRDGEVSAGKSKVTEGIESNRVIEDADVSCPDITFGTTGGDAEVQTGNNKFKFLFGKSIKYNQIVENPLFTSNTKWAAYSNNVSVSIANNKATVTVQTAGAAVYNYGVFETLGSIRFIVGHKYLVYVKVNSSSMNNFRIELGGSNSSDYILGSDKLICGIQTVTTLYNQQTMVFPVTASQITVGATYEVSKYYVFDLTALGINTTDKNVALESLNNMGINPEMALPFNESTILSAKSSELVSVGENQWDEQWEVGWLGSDGATSQTYTDRIRSKNFIRVLSDTEYYYVEGTSSNVRRVCFYDANQNFISYLDYADSPFTTPANCYYLKFATGGDYGTSYKHDISLYICWDTPGRPYVANRTDRVTLPNIELRSVPDYTNGGEIRDEAYQVGGGKRYVGVYTFTGSENWVKSSHCYIMQTPLTNVKLPTGSTYYWRANIVHAKLQVASWQTLSDGNPTSGVALTFNDGKVVISENDYASISSLTGTQLLYELATTTDIPTSENPGWTELVYTDNYGTLQFLTDPAQIPQVPQPYYIEYTVSLTDFLDATYAHAEGDATKLALQQSVDDIVNGNTPAGKALLADNLESNNKIEDLLPYTMRQAPSGVGKSMLLDHFTGATVAWNQLADCPTTASTSWTGGTYSITNNKVTIVCSASGSTVNAQVFALNIPIIAGHKYYVRTTGITSADPFLLYGNTVQLGIGETMQAPSASGTVNFRCYKSGGFASQTTYTFYINVFDVTQMFGSTIANYLYNQGTAGTNKFRNLFPKPYYPYNAGELVGIKTAGRKAIGINQFDQITESGAIGAQGQEYSDANVIRVKNYLPVVPGVTYYINTGSWAEIRGYDADKNFIGNVPYTAATGGYTLAMPQNCRFVRWSFTAVYGTTYKNDICLNISDPTINGTFYPYEADEYPCEEVELNGMYELDANNNIVAKNGDTYSNGGTLGRKWGKVDMGTLEWTRNSTSGIFSATIADIKISSNNRDISLVNAKYTCLDGKQAFDSSWNKVIYCISLGNSVNVMDSAYSDAATFKTAMNGVYLVYPLAAASQTEETASSFASTQKTGVTEQFMEPELAMTVFLPVGHDSFYLPDLKEKLEVAPDSPTSDGTYLVSRSGGTNVYIPIANVTATQAEIDEIIAILE